MLTAGFESRAPHARQPAELGRSGLAIADTLVLRYKRALDFDENQLKFLRQQAKRHLRKRMRATRSAVPKRALSERSARIVEHLLACPEYEQARGIALFWPILEYGEVDLRALDARCREHGRRVYYPAGDLETGRPGFRLVANVAELQEHGAGFAEPDPSAPWAEAEEIDWIVVPALAVDERRHRLGYGSGFYDLALAAHCPPARSVAVAYSFQLLAELPVEPHDATCDAIVTDDGRL